MSLVKFEKAFNHYFLRDFCSPLFISFPFGTSITQALAFYVCSTRVLWSLRLRPLFSFYLSLSLELGNCCSFFHFIKTFLSQIFCWTHSLSHFYPVIVCFSFLHSGFFFFYFCTETFFFWSSLYFCLFQTCL